MSECAGQGGARAGNSPIELEPPGPCAAGLADGLDGARRRGGHDVRHADGARGLRGRDLAVRVDDALHADGRDEQGRAVLDAEQRRLCGRGGQGRGAARLLEAKETRTSRWRTVASVSMRGMMRHLSSSARFQRSAEQLPALPKT